MDEKNIKDRAVLEENSSEKVPPEAQGKPPEQAKPLILPASANAKEPPKKSPVRRIITMVVLLSVLGFGVVYGYNTYKHGLTHEETDNATVTGHIFQISPKITGTVAKVMVTDNQEVKKGQVLLKLDTTDYEINVLRARAALEVAKRQSSASKSTIALAEKNFAALATQATGNIQSSESSINTAEVSVQEAQNVLAASQAQLSQIKVNVKKAEADYNRYIPLAKQGAIPTLQLDTLKATADALKAQELQTEQIVNQNRTRVASAKENISRAKAQLYTSKGGLEQANATQQQAEINKSQYQVAVASISQAQVALKDALNQLSYTTIVAPADGRIGKKSVEIGQRLQPGQPLMAVVGKEAWVLANFKETQLENVKNGQPVEIKLDAFPNHKFNGKVDSVAPGSGAIFALLPPDNATGNFTKIVQRIPVKIVFSNDNDKEIIKRVTPGMSAIVSIETK